jgi:long-subunit fatty acid transport protein
MFDASSFSIAAGYGHSLTDRFAFGLNIKYVTERISEVRSQGFAFDFGTQYETGFKNLRMGLNISNLGPGLKFAGSDLNIQYRRDGSDFAGDPVDQDNTNYDPSEANVATETYDLPLSFRFGLAYDLSKSEDAVWTVTADAKHPNDNVQQFSLGSEYAWNETVALRAGYKFRSEEEGLTLGGGVNLSPTPSTNLVIDYAWSDFGRLQSVHRFSFGLRF